MCTHAFVCACAPIRLCVHVRVRASVCMWMQWARWGEGRVGLRTARVCMLRGGYLVYVSSCDVKKQACSWPSTRVEPLAGRTCSPEAAAARRSTSRSRCACSRSAAMSRRRRLRAAHVSSNPGEKSVSKYSSLLVYTAARAARREYLGRRAERET